VSEYGNSSSSALKQKIRVVPCAVDLARYDSGCLSSESIAEATRSYGIQPSSPVVVFCGRMIPHKGTDILISAIPAVTKSLPNARFLIVGDGPERGSLEKLADQLGIRACCVFTGVQTNDQLVRIFHSMDVLCLPSRVEPFGMVILEAWACQKPVVATRQGGPSWFVSDGVDGLLVDIESSSMASGLVRLLESPALSSQLGAAGRSKVEARFTYDKVAESTVAVYREGSEAP